MTVNHVHYDLEAFERQLRADSARSNAAHAKRVADGKASASFHAAQAAFYECAIQFGLATARLSNEGHDDGEIIAAAAISTGLSLGSLLANLSASEARAGVAWFEKALNDAIRTIRDPGAETVLTSTEISEAPIMPGSRA